MTKNPVFSILIPTKNRPDLVADAVASVLLQDGPQHDVELVVSNNGGGEETKRAIARWQTDPRLRYIEPPTELSMPDHWEWGSRLLKGDYVLILSDRLLLRQGALNSLRQLISSNPPPQVISWPLASYSELSGTAAGMGDPASPIQGYSSRSIWEGLKQGQYFFSPILPRGLNSCVHKDIYGRIRQTRGRVFDLITPDFSSAFSVVFVSDAILHHGRPLTIAQGARFSNGTRMLRGVDTGYMKRLGSTGESVNVPLRDTASPLVTAVMYEDFLRCAAAFGSPIRWDEMNPVSFYRECFREVVMRHVASPPWSSGLRQLRRDYTEAMMREGKERYSRIRRALRRTFPWGDLRSVAVETWLGPQSAAPLRRVFHRLKGWEAHPTALVAAGFGKKS
jgi:hypothetical protein